MRGSEISVLAARHDDDDDDHTQSKRNIFISGLMIFIIKCFGTIVFLFIVISSTFRV